MDEEDEERDEIREEEDGERKDVVRKRVEENKGVR